MDWVLIFQLVFCTMAGMVVGIRLERSRRAAEVDSYEIPEEDMSDGAYWKKRYEEMVAEDARFMAELVKETKDVRGKTT